MIHQVLTFSCGAKVDPSRMRASDSLCVAAQGLDGLETSNGTSFASLPTQSIRKSSAFVTFFY
jgi:hypothetical protein